MRTTINIDEQLLAEAARISSFTERTMLIHQGLQALIQRASAKRLARLGGTRKMRKVARRRRAAT
jgi:Arc/MetJ family transcription regulator